MLETWRVLGAMLSRLHPVSNITTCRCELRMLATLTGETGKVPGLALAV